MSKTRVSVSFNGSSHSEIGLFLGTRRVELGLSVKTVASSLNISVPFLSSIEHGRAPLPATYVVNLAKTLKVEPSYVAALALKHTNSYRRLQNQVVEVPTVSTYDPTE